MNKKITFILLLNLLFAGTFAQSGESQIGQNVPTDTMRLLGGNIYYYNGMEIKLGVARDIAGTSNKPQAYSYFKKAKRMRGWNYVWSILGGYEVGAGFRIALSETPLGWLDVGIGGGLIALVVAREDKIENYKRLGVQAFNK